MVRSSCVALPNCTGSCETIFSMCPEKQENQKYWWLLAVTTTSSTDKRFVLRSRLLFGQMCILQISRKVFVPPKITLEKHLRIQQTYNSMSHVASAKIAIPGSQKPFSDQTGDESFGPDETVKSLNRSKNCPDLATATFPSLCFHLSSLDNSSWLPFHFSHREFLTPDHTQAVSLCLWL